jgi:hypothetical protein
MTFWELPYVKAWQCDRETGYYVSIIVRPTLCSHLYQGHKYTSRCIHSITPTPSPNHLTQDLQPSLRLASCLLNTSTSLITSAVIATLALFVILPMAMILWRDSIDLSGTSSQQNRMTADILSLHISRSLEELISIAETHKPIAFALRRTLVADNSCLLHTSPSCKRLVK